MPLCLVLPDLSSENYLESRTALGFSGVSSLLGDTGSRREELLLNEKLASSYSEEACSSSLEMSKSPST